MVKVVGDIGRVAVWVRPRPGVPNAGRAAVLSHCTLDLRCSRSGAQKECRPLRGDGRQVVRRRRRRRRSLRGGHWPANNRLNRIASIAVFPLFCLGRATAPRASPLLRQNSFAASHNQLYFLCKRHQAIISQAIVSVKALPAGPAAHCFYQQAQSLA